MGNQTFPAPPIACRTERPSTCTEPASMTPPCTVVANDNKQRLIALLDQASSIRNAIDPVCEAAGTGPMPTRTGLLGLLSDTTEVIAHLEHIVSDLGRKIV